MDPVVVGKAQAVRVLDVVVFGPVLLWVAAQRRSLTEWERWAVGLIGLGTILYNWWHYAQIKAGNTSGSGSGSASEGRGGATTAGEPSGGGNHASL